jgi:hypothetical protein
MKKLLGCFWSIILLIFWTSLSVQATPLPSSGFVDGGAVYLGGTPDLEESGWTDQVQQDTLSNIAEVIRLYNDANSASYYTPTSVPEPVEDGYPIDSSSGEITLDGNTAYLTLKWNHTFGLWDVGGLTSVTFSTSKGLSHYRSIPDASIVLLLGSSFLCLALLTRKRRQS